MNVSYKDWLVGSGWDLPQEMRGSSQHRRIEASTSVSTDRGQSRPGWPSATRRPNIWCLAFLQVDGAHAVAQHSESQGSSRQPSLRTGLGQRGGSRHGEAQGRTPGPGWVSSHKPGPQAEKLRGSRPRVRSSLYPQASSRCEPFPSSLKLLSSICPQTSHLRCSTSTMQHVKMELSLLPSKQALSSSKRALFSSSPSSDNGTSIHTSRQIRILKITPTPLHSSLFGLNWSQPYDFRSIPSSTVSGRVLTIS